MIPGNGVGGDVDGRRVLASLGGARRLRGTRRRRLRRALRRAGRLALDDAVALLADGRTATMLLRAAAIAPGERVLVEAAAGGVGTLLVQLAKAAGATVIAAAGGDAKLELARSLGADELVDYTEPDWAERSALRRRLRRRRRRRSRGGRSRSSRRAGGCSATASRAARGRRSAPRRPRRAASRSSSPTARRRRCAPAPRARSRAGHCGRHRAALPARTGRRRARGDRVPLDDRQDPARAGMSGNAPVPASGQPRCAGGGLTRRPPPPLPKEHPVFKRIAILTARRRRRPPPRRRSGQLAAADRADQAAAGQVDPRAGPDDCAVPHVERLRDRRVRRPQLPGAANPVNDAPGPAGVMPAGLRGVKSQTRKNESSWRPETRSASAVNCPIDTGRPRWLRTSGAGAGRTLRRRSACAARAGSSRRACRPATSSRSSGPGSPIFKAHPVARRRVSRVGVEDRLRGLVALALAPQPLGVGREALVEPDVLPRRDRQGVADPLVGELVHDHRLGLPLARSSKKPCE